MLQLPATKVYIDASYLTAGAASGLVSAYLLAVDARANSALKFTVLLDSGGVWSGLPICAIYAAYDGDESALDTSKAKANEELQPFSCLEGPVSLISYGLLKDVEVTTPLGNGQYMFTINYEGSGLAEDPEQYKTHNIICLFESGQLCALPNNMMRVVNNWSTDASVDVSQYRRTSLRYFPGG